MLPVVPRTVGPVSTTTARDGLIERAVAYFAAHGVGDVSLRSLAAEIGTSHRMLHYHFGSREGLLAAVVEVVARRGLEDVEATLRAENGTDPGDLAWTAWNRWADEVSVVAPLFFELSAHTMVGHPWAEPLREQVAQTALGIADYLEKVGNPPERAAVLARTAMALARGALFDLALTGDRAAADDVIRRFLERPRAAEPA